MSNFNTFKVAVQQRYAAIKHLPLFVSNATKDELWDTYLNTLTKSGNNDIYRERGEHDCQCCKQFIRRIGNVVVIQDGELVSIWDNINIGIKHYDDVAKAMADLVTTSGIRGIFLHGQDSCGTDSNIELIDGSAHTWEHFYVELQPAHYETDGPTRSQLIGAAGEHQYSLKLSMEQLTIDAVNIVIDLVESDGLYRGTEHLSTLKLMRTLLTEYQEHWLWLKSRELGAMSTLRNTVIGTLVKDISEGVELESAVKSFESKVAPANYKRSSALVTKGMIQDAEKAVVNLGVAESLPRRHATITDITINNVLFADKTAVQQMGGVFGQLLQETKDKVDVSKATPITIHDFIASVLPYVTTLDAYLGNPIAQSNAMTLVAPVNPDAPSILKWDNNFTWAYNGDVTDSMREAVVAAGGRVDGVLRFTHSWNHTGQNQSLMDLHVFLPTHTSKNWGTANDSYGTTARVGWNNRKHSLTKGVQDVDFTEPPFTEVPLENITFPSLHLLPEGVYKLAIHNWAARSPNITGFKAEVEFEGQVYQYDYPKALANKEWVVVAEVTLRNGKFSIEHKIPCDTSGSREVWGLNTEKFHRVSTMMYSPNHWDEQSIGNKHFFFILEGFKNPEPVRGFYPEFLKQELNPHRKVLELLGSKMKAPVTDEQLSGLGFSSTVRNSLVVRVNKGRLYEVKF